MSTTYLDVCNRVLRRLNEAEISTPNFGSVRGIHALVKDAVNDALSDIDKREFEWHFNAAEHSTTLRKGQTEYSFPDDFKVADWMSFQLQKDDSLSVGYKRLKFMDRDVWYRNHRDEDSAAGSEGRDVPDHVFASHGLGFGVTPAPDADYKIRFRYFLKQVELTEPDDIILVPDAHVVVDGAMYYLNIFKSNFDAAALWSKKFEKGITQLQTLYINHAQEVSDRRTGRSLRATRRS